MAVEKVYTFIDLAVTPHGSRETREGHLAAYGRQHPLGLFVSGPTEHGCVIEPATIEDAQKLKSWCDFWIEKQKEKAGQ